MGERGYGRFVEREGVRYLGQSVLFLTPSRLSELRGFLQGLGVDHHVVPASVGPGSSKLGGLLRRPGCRDSAQLGAAMKAAIVPPALNVVAKETPDIFVAAIMVGLTISEANLPAPPSLEPSKILIKSSSFYPLTMSIRGDHGRLFILVPPRNRWPNS